MKSKFVYVIILNWNHYDDTAECIESVKKNNYDNFRILVVDNNSSDDSVKRLRENFPEIEIIQNSQNLGFAGGNNVGMRYALTQGADYLLILNNDVTIDKNCIAELVRFAQEIEDVGMLAPKVYYYDYPKTINSLGTSIDWLRLKPKLSYCGKQDKGQFNNNREVDILVGCAIMVKKETLERIGLIDEKFFIFHEEADWCLRNIKSGFKNMVVPLAVAYHKASKTMRKFSAATAYYSIRNFLYLAHKNASFMNRIKTIAGLCFLVCKNMVILLFKPDTRILTKAFLLGTCDYFRGDMGKCKRFF
jgi:GT2 family glycosyltransferase